MWRPEGKAAELYMKHWLQRIWRDREPLVGVDLGSSSFNIVELDFSLDQPVLVRAEVGSVNGEPFSNNLITKPEELGRQLDALLAAPGGSRRRAAVALPGSSAFIKKFSVPALTGGELDATIRLEAGNYVPHALDAVALAYHLTPGVRRDLLDVLLVAVKREVIDSFCRTVSSAGIEPVVVDVEFFALQNIFEFNYPELLSHSVALVNMGARHASFNLTREGYSSVTGDIPVGGRSFSEEFVRQTGDSIEQAEQALRSGSGPVSEVVEQVADEFVRQLKFLCGAADRGVDSVFMCGGGMRIPGFLDAVAKKSGFEVQQLNPVRRIKLAPGIDITQISLQAPFLAIAAGLALRTPGDSAASVGGATRRSRR